MAASHRTQEERRAATRRDLLDAARRVFGERGYGAATLDQVAAAAGLTRGALYYNFPGGKADLFLALLEERLASRADAIRGRFAGEQDVAGLTAAAAAAADDTQDAVSPNREWQLLTFEFALQAARDADFGRRFAEHEDAIRDAIEQIVVERAQAIGLVPPIPAHELAVALSALGTGLGLTELVAPGSVAPGLFGRFVTLLARGILADAGESSTQQPKGTT